MALAGAHSDVKLATPQVQEIADQVKTNLEENVGKGPFERYQLLEFRRQVVAGMNYTFKIQISSSECVHAKVFQPLPHEQRDPVVQKYALHSLSDPLELL